MLAWNIPGHNHHCVVVLWYLICGNNLKKENENRYRITHALIFIDFSLLNLFYRKDEEKKPVIHYVINVIFILQSRYSR